MISDKQKIAAAQKYCTESGIKLTEKRKQVLTCMVEASNALSAYDVISALQAKYQIRMQAMSVYRILDFLHQENLIHKLELVNKYIVCSHIACDHEHQPSQFLICNKCTSVAEVSIDQSLVNSLKEVAEKSGYYFASNQIEFNCICKSCSSS